MNRRPPFEPRPTQRGSTTGELDSEVYLMKLRNQFAFVAPEDIVLGPPKTSFASASGSRNGVKSLDSITRPNVATTDDEDVRTDRLRHKERSAKDGYDADKDGEKPREPRLGNLHNRKNTKEDNEPWSGLRQQKAFGHDDAERGIRRNGDREKEKDEGREPRPHRGFENHRRDADREPNNGEPSGRRNMPMRGRFEPSWHRDDDRQDGELQESNKDTPKPRDWRDKDKGTRGENREWIKSAKPEQDPEWLDEPAPEEKKWAHTQEDFQRWKERMKATNGPNQELPLCSPEQRHTHERATSSISLTNSKVKAETPLVVDPGFDGFFGLWSEGSKEQDAQEPTKSQASKVNTSKPSKFTGFFSSKTISETPEPEPPRPPTQPIETAKDSSNEDKEGFQRILKLLAGNDAQAPPREKASQETPLAHSAHPARPHEPSALESLLGSQHPKDFPIPQNKDSEFLLRLMQQTQQTRPNQPNPGSQRQDSGSASRVQFPTLRISPRDANQQAPSAGPPPAFFNDIPREEVQHCDRLNPTTSERKVLPPGFFTGFSPEVIQRNSGAVVNHSSLQSSMPSVLQRPPGLEQNASAYGQSIQPQRQQGMVPPPPGFQAPMRAHNTFPPGLIPNLSNPTLSEQRGPPYGLRSVGPTGPTGMPPPGFMNMNPLPPGVFPPPHYNQDGRISPPPGSRLYYSGRNGLRQGIDGYGAAESAANNSFGLGGQQGILPGQYRRQD